MSAHTPGPWIVDETSDARSAGYIREEKQTEDGRRISVARASSSGRRHSEFLANARLISAAPDLLAELKALVELIKERSYVPGYEDLGAHVTGSERAIAKAEGKS